MLPSDAAGELLAAPRHTLQVTYGCPPASRAKMFPLAIFVSATFSDPASSKNRLSVAFSRARPLSRLILRPRPHLVARQL
jgi:hypothetical protein